jgi:beta-glucanase (GH16 family)
MRAILLLIPIALAAQTAPNRELVWSDEFNGEAGFRPDPAKWTYDLGATGWGNRELEEYTNRAENAAMDGGGHLVIRAIRTAEGKYTSARLKTQGLFDVRYGKIEARMRLPVGQGIWPAFWMLGSDIKSAGWPRCGEIDMLENIGKEPSIAHGTAHGPGFSRGKGITARVALPDGARLGDDFHVFGVEWSEAAIEFLLDGKSYSKVTPASLPPDTKWVYDHPFFLLLNVAVGGNWPGYPDETTKFPQTMLVDWVRVWRPAR